MRYTLHPKLRGRSSSLRMRTAISPSHWPYRGVWCSFIIVRFTNLCWQSQDGVCKCRENGWQTRLPGGIDYNRNHK